MAPRIPDSSLTEDFLSGIFSPEGAMADILEQLAAHAVKRTKRKKEVV